MPPLPAGARHLAARMGFERSCADEIGRLLRVQVGRVRQGRTAEIGAGCGVGAPWLASGLALDASVVTVEGDAVPAAAAQALFDGMSNVRVLHGDRARRCPT